MKRIIRAVPAFLLLILPYVLIVLIELAAYWDRAADGYVYEDIIFKNIPIIWGIIALLNIIWTILQTVSGVSAQKLLFWNMLIKLCYIPVFFFAFFGGVIPGFMMFFFGGIIMSLMAALIMLALFIPPCIYGVCGCIRASKEGSIYKALAVILAILNCIMCIDVIAAVVSYYIVKSSNKKHLKDIG